MDSIFSYITESLFCGALFYVLFSLIVSGKTSYNFQRVYLLISSLFTAIFPLISIPSTVGGIFLVNLPEIVIIGNRGAGTLTSESAKTFTMNGDILYILYFAILCLFVIMFVFQLGKVFYISKMGQKTRREGTTIIMSNMVNTPFSFFNHIFIRNDTEPEEAECIISHENAHAERHHSIDVLFISLVTSIQWFNPFIYMLKGDLISIHEYQADKDVLKCGFSINYYRRLMLCSQFGLTPFVANRLNNSLTIKRLKKMENLNEKRNRLITIVSVVLVTSALFFVVSCKNNSSQKEPDKQQVAEQSTPTPQAPEAVKEATPPSTPTVPESPKMKSSVKFISPKIVKDNKIEAYTVVENMPEFPGGEKALMDFICKNIKYPPDDMENQIQGKAVVRFIVAEDGSVKNIELLKSPSKSMGEEAIRVISMMPKWTPGTQAGKVVPVYFVMPVVFKLK